MGAACWCYKVPGADPTDDESAHEANFTHRRLVVAESLRDRSMAASSRDGPSQSRQGAASSRRGFEQWAFCQETSPIPLTDGLRGFEQWTFGSACSSPAAEGANDRRDEVVELPLEETSPRSPSSPSCVESARGILSTPECKLQTGAAVTPECKLGAAAAELSEGEGDAVVTFDVPGCELDAQPTEKCEQACLPQFDSGAVSIENPGALSEEHTREQDGLTGSAAEPLWTWHLALPTDQSEKEAEETERGPPSTEDQALEHDVGTRFFPQSSIVKLPSVWTWQAEFRPFRVPVPSELVSEVTAEECHPRTVMLTRVNCTSEEQTQEQDGTMSAFADPFSLRLPSVWTWQLIRPAGDRNRLQSDECSRGTVFLAPVPCALEDALENIPAALTDPLFRPSVWTWQVNRPKGVVPGSVAAPQSTAQDACVSGQDITEDATPNLPTGAEGEPATTLPSAFTWSLGKTMLLSQPQDPSSMGAFERLFTNMHNMHRAALEASPAISPMRAEDEPDVRHIGPVDRQLDSLETRRLALEAQALDLCSRVAPSADPELLDLQLDFQERVAAAERRIQAAVEQETFMESKRAGLEARAQSLLHLVPQAATLDVGVGLVDTEHLVQRVRAIERQVAESVREVVPGDGDA